VILRGAEKSFSGLFKGCFAGIDNHLVDFLDEISGLGLYKDNFLLNSFAKW